MKKFVQKILISCVIKFLFTIKKIKKSRKERQKEEIQKKDSNYFLQISKDIDTVIETKPDFVVQIQAGLGNQMFQYAFSKALKGKVLYDISFFSDDERYAYGLDKFNIDVPCVKNKYIFGSVIKKNEIAEKVLNKFEPELLTGHASGYYQGFFQTEKYFRQYRNELVQEFKVRIPFDENYKKMLGKIKSTNSVLVNFRVGADYQHLGWVISGKYQKDAMDMIAQKISNPHFFIFADDIEYVRKHFKPDYGVTFVDMDKKNPDRIYLDLELIKNCKHDIVVNSTYSWWGAWLNENPDKIVIAPHPWFFDRESCIKFNSSDEDVLPEEWIKINSI